MKRSIPVAASALTPPPFRLDGKRALVTGASRGIGRAAAEALAGAGARVAVNYARSADEAEATAAAIAATGADAKVLQGDMGKPEDVDSVFKQLQELWGGVDIVVNNAAVTRDGFVMLMPVEAWDEVMDVDLRGPFLCVRHALRPMIRQRWGRIVNVISPAALLGKQGAANYAAAKGGLLSFTKSLAREVGRYGINVNAVCPGLIDTRMIAGLPADEKKRFQQQIALGRFGDPSEVAQAILFLSSPAASYVTGATLTVDGGLTMA